MAENYPAGYRRLWAGYYRLSDGAGPYAWDGGSGFTLVGSNKAGASVGGGVLLDGEANGFATDFLHPVDAERVAVKTAGTVVASTVDGFFTNAGTSPKMVYDASGVLGWSPHNFILQSKDASLNQIDTANCTITANVTAGPFGDVTADQMAFAGGNSAYYSKGSSLAPVAGTTYCGSVWIKAAAPVQIGMRFCTVTGSVQGVLLASVTTSWQRFSVTMTATDATGLQLGFDVRTFIAGDDGLAKTVIAADWQINRGTVPTGNVATTTAARFGLALDYDPVTHAAKGLLCEPAATNLALSSQELASGPTPEGGTVTSNNQTGPDGLSTADTFTENTATINHGAYAPLTVTANTDYTLSRFYKMGTRRYASLGWADGTNGCYAVYDLQSGVVGSSATFGTGVLNSASMQALPNGWYRCILSGKFPAGTTAYYTQQAATAATITVDGFGRQTFLGTGATLFMGPVQVETGTVATSLIPTSAGATVTRAVDLPSITSASIPYSGTAGSWWIEVDQIAALSVARVIGYPGGNAPVFLASATQFALYDGNVVGKTVTSVLGPHKIAVAFASADRAATADGLAVVTNVVAGVALLTPGATIGIGAELSGANHSYIRKVRYLPRRPSNAELVTMST